MSDKNTNNSDASKKKTIKVFLADKYVCNYISTEWFKEDKSLREYGRLFSIHQHVVKKIKEKDGYKIPFSTLVIICFYKKIKLPDFLAAVEEKYGPFNENFFEKETI
jgi:hypothetical protein